MPLVHMISGFASLIDLNSCLLPANGNNINVSVLPKDYYISMAFSFLTILVYLTNRSVTLMALRQMNQLDLLMFTR